MGQLGKTTSKAFFSAEPLYSGAMGLGQSGRSASLPRLCDSYLRQSLDEGGSDRSNLLQIASLRSSLTINGSMSKSSITVYYFCRIFGIFRLIGKISATNFIASLRSRGRTPAHRCEMGKTTPRP